MYRQMLKNGNLGIETEKIPEIQLSVETEETKSLMEKTEEQLLEEREKRRQVRDMISGFLNQMAQKDDQTIGIGQQTLKQLCRIDEDQKVILKRTFALMEKDMVNNGLKILVLLFAEYPQYKKIWPQFRAIPDSSLMNAIELRKHASVYMCGLRQIIYSLENEKDLADHLNRIARAHIKWSVYRHHVEHMCAPVLETLGAVSGGIDEKTKEAWTRLYDVIANLIEIYREVNKNKVTRR
ncbi:unnamed protein product, partial [Mesorhabditis belari]|uniref:Globin family profile domain-containing protein n=1 Tax=Mesorhabditis belari TaxID=2138241 RepID=A0AAF3EQX0_9BILA